jgi:hypothetical protein
MSYPNGWHYIRCCQLEFEGKTLDEIVEKWNHRRHDELEPAGIVGNAPRYCPNHPTVPACSPHHSDLCADCLLG